MDFWVHLRNVRLTRTHTHTQIYTHILSIHSQVILLGYLLEGITSRRYLVRVILAARASDRSRHLLTRKGYPRSLLLARHSYLVRGYSSSEGGIKCIFQPLAHSMHTHISTKRAHSIQIMGGLQPDCAPL